MSFGKTSVDKTMATQEERDRILAEYMQAAEADNGDDEEEFQGSDDYSDDDDDVDDDSATSTQDDNYAVLQGNLVLNDEGRVVYSGTWCMRKDLAKETNTATETSTTATKTVDGKENEQGAKQEKETVGDKKKKKTKFKLKSKQVLGKGSKHPFDLRNPLLENDKPRTILFDGFFTTDETDTIQPYRKIKERDIELIFSQSITSKKKTSSTNISANGNGVLQDKDESKETKSKVETEEQKFVVRGNGSNEFGKFCMEGIYYCNPSFADNGNHNLTCSKRYDFQKAAAAARKRRYDESEDDYEMSDSEPADLNELIGLSEDANLSIEDLKKKYNADGSGEINNCNGPGNGNNDGDEKLPAKRSKIEEEEDDDDGCGF